MNYKQEPISFVSNIKRWQYLYCIVYSWHVTQSLKLFILFIKGLSKKKDFFPKRKDFEEWWLTGLWNWIFLLLFKWQLIRWSGKGWKQFLRHTPITLRDWNLINFQIYWLSFARHLLQQQRKWKLFIVITCWLHVPGNINGIYM